MREVSKPRFGWKSWLNSCVRWIVMNGFRKVFCQAWGMDCLRWRRATSVCGRALKRGEERRGGVDQASWSASSFPEIPEWPGTQIKLILQLWKCSRNWNMLQMCRIMGEVLRLYREWVRLFMADLCLVCNFKIWYDLKHTESCFGAVLNRQCLPSLPNLGSIRLSLVMLRLKSFLADVLPWAFVTFVIVSMPSAILRIIRSSRRQLLRFQFLLQFSYSFLRVVVACRTESPYSFWNQ